jgi:Coenzyme PQQ synthesis protein D (PqqD)
MEGRIDVLAPRARAAGLVIRELEDETLVYDVERNDAHCLNRTAALVWAQCNGATTIAEIVDFLRTELNPEADEGTVWQAILQLHGNHLLEDQISRPAAVPGMTRQELLQRIGVVAVAATITSLAIPTIASAASGCVTTGSPCSQGPEGNKGQNGTCVGCNVLHGVGGIICCNNGATCCNGECCPQNMNCVGTGTASVCQ